MSNNDDKRIITQGAISIYTNSFGVEIKFIDKRPYIYSSKCEPRDISLLNCDHLNDADQRALRQDICVDIRLSQGLDKREAARNLLW